MRTALPALIAVIGALAAAPAPALFSQAEEFSYFAVGEQRSLCVRDPSQLRRAPMPEIPAPATVADAQADLPELLLSLDEALRIALANSEVVRVLAGMQAVASGATIYDPAIANTRVDEESSRFNPRLRVDNDWRRFEDPGAEFLDPNNPGLGSRIAGSRSDNYEMDFELSKTTRMGGTLDFGINAAPSRIQPGVFPLNPRTRSSMELSFTQPLLQGGGFRANLAPIVVARIDTERSYFQMKDKLQDLVLGVIEAYWELVAARTDVWARSKQVEQARFAKEYTEAQEEFGRANAGQVAQTRVALANFRADLIAARANLLQREAALRNILGWPPSDGRRIVPVTPPRATSFEFAWDALLELTQQRRPDIIEQKLILEADRRLLDQSRNLALPRLDGVAIYRWNGLEGEMRNGASLSSRPGRFTDWTLGVNFSVPLGLRKERAALRRQELIIARDAANLQQSVHSAAHLLAEDVRNLAQFYAQYQAFSETRDAASTNLDLQLNRYRIGIGQVNQSQYLNLLLAITDWGNAISAQAATLTRYNAALANLERTTGTILETHGIELYEERFAAIGPLGRFARRRCYPSAVRPGENETRYPTSDRPAEESFDLNDIPDSLRRPARWTIRAEARCESPPGARSFRSVFGFARRRSG